MAHIVVILSGLADDPHDCLRGGTPLQEAATPFLDELGQHSEVGLLRPVPERADDDPAIGADQTTLAIFGYQDLFYGRGALELLGAGAALGSRDCGIRFDLLSLRDKLDPFPAPPTKDEARLLWADLSRACSREALTIRGVSPLTGLGLWPEGPVEVGVKPPGELTDDPLEDQYPEGDRELELRELIETSREVLANHKVNRDRAERDEPTLDVLWPWGFGRAPQVKLFPLKTGQIATVLADTVAVRGAARAVGISCPRLTHQPPRALIDLADLALASLDQAPTVVVHSCLADRAAHTGDPERKKAVIEQLDLELIKPLSKLLQRHREVSLSLLCDYATSSATRRHANRPVPYLSLRPHRDMTGPDRFEEAKAADTGRLREGATDLLAWLWET